jgi:hypothetical protein
VTCYLELLFFFLEGVCAGAAMKIPEKMKSVSLLARQKLIFQANSLNKFSTDRITLACSPLQFAGQYPAISIFPVNFLSYNLLKYIDF